MTHNTPAHTDISHASFLHSSFGFLGGKRKNELPTTTQPPTFQSPKVTIADNIDFLAAALQTRIHLIDSCLSV
jgi:hypothetical protein